jgi:hypothetical protein
VKGKGEKAGGGEGKERVGGGEGNGEEKGGFRKYFQTKVWVGVWGATRVLRSKQEFLSVSLHRALLGFPALPLWGTLPQRTPLPRGSGEARVGGGVGSRTKKANRTPTRGSNGGGGWVTNQKANWTPIGPQVDIAAGDREKEREREGAGRRWGAGACGEHRVGKRRCGQ